MVSNLLLASAPRDGSAQQGEQGSSWKQHHEVVDDLHRDVYRTRDPGLLEQLLIQYRGLAYHYAKRFTAGGEPLDDLEQVAMLATFRALNRFDPQRGVKFTTYAGRVISGELKRHLRDHAWPVRVPRPLQELYLRARNAVSILEVERGHTPTVTEVAEFLGSSEEEVLEAMELAVAYRLPSLDALARTPRPVSLLIRDARTRTFWRPTSDSGRGKSWGPLVSGSTLPTARSWRCTSLGT